MYTCSFYSQVWSISFAFLHDDKYLPIHLYCASIMCACINYDIVLCSAKIRDKAD